MEHLIRLLVRVKFQCQNHLACCNCIFYQDTEDDNESSCKIMELIDCLYTLPSEWDEKKIRRLLK